MSLCPPNPNLTENGQRYWSALVSQLSPYEPGEQSNAPGLIKLNTNENPYPPSPKVLAAIRAATDESLRLYPHPTAEPVQRAAGELYGVPPAQVFVGNGSDEVLAHVFLGLLKQERPLVMPDITYSFYPVYCGLYDISYQLIPVDAGFRIRPEDFPTPNGGIIFANPNAPTGMELLPDQIESLLRRNTESVVVVDEAYADFGGHSVLPLVNRYPNLLVVRTLSKAHSLAGLRVGLAIGSPDLILALERVKNCFNSYPIDRLAAVGAAAALGDREYFEQTRDRVIRARGQLTEGLERLGFQILPSVTNFVMARHPARDAAALAEALRQRRILVRHFARPRIDQYLRITVGTPTECLALLEALGELVS